MAKKLSYEQWLAENESKLGLKDLYLQEMRGWQAEVATMYPEHVAECKAEGTKPLTKPAFTKLVMEQWPNYGDWTYIYFDDVISK